MDELEKEILDAALTGGKCDGRLLIYQIQALLRESYMQNEPLGLMPKEFVIYLANALLHILDSPTNTDTILKIAKPPKSPGKKINLTRDGLITYLCMKEKEAHPENSDNKVFGDVAYNISEDYKKQLLNETKEEISLKTIERVYKRTIPILRQFKNIKAFEWIYDVVKNEAHTDSPNIAPDFDKQLYDDFKEEIANYEIMLMVENEIANGDADLYPKMQRKLQEIKKLRDI